MISRFPVRWSLLFATWMAIGSAGIADEPEWPQWRGPTFNGISTESDLADA